MAAPFGTFRSIVESGAAMCHNDSLTQFTWARPQSQKLLFEGGVVPEPFAYRDDKRVIEFGIGLTDLVKRPAKTMDLLAREDFAEGRIVLSQKLEEFAPRVVAFNGKAAYEFFAQRKCTFGA